MSSLGKWDPSLARAGGTDPPPVGSPSRSPMRRTPGGSSFLSLGTPRAVIKERQTQLVVTDVPSLGLPPPSHAKTDLGLRFDSKYARMSEMEFVTPIDRIGRNYAPAARALNTRRVAREQLLVETSKRKKAAADKTAAKLEAQMSEYADPGASTRSTASKTATARAAASKRSRYAAGEDSAMLPIDATQEHAALLATRSALLGAPAVSAAAAAELERYETIVRDSPMENVASQKRKWHRHAYNHLVERGVMNGDDARAVYAMSKDSASLRAPIATLPPSFPEEKMEEDAAANAVPPPSSLAAAQARAEACALAPLMGQMDVAESVLSEIQSTYVTASQKAAVEYAILDPRYSAKLRLSVPLVRSAVDWTPFCANPHRTSEWRVLRKTNISHDRVIRATEALSQHPVTDPISEVVQGIWLDEFAELTLHDFADHSLRAQLPLELHDFVAAVKKSTKAYRKKLLEAWLPDVAVILAERLKDSAFTGSANAVARSRLQLSVRTLMSLQLRSAVEVALRTLAGFAEWAGDVKANHHCAIVLTLRVDEVAAAAAAAAVATKSGEEEAASGTISLSPPTADVERTIVSAVDILVGLDIGGQENFPAADTLIAAESKSPKGRSKGRSKFAAPTSLIEDNAVEATTLGVAAVRLAKEAQPARGRRAAVDASVADEVVKQTKTSLSARLTIAGATANEAVAKFGKFASLFDGTEKAYVRTAIQERLDGGDVGATLRGMAGEVARYRALHDEARATIPDMIALPFYEIRCGDFRAQVEEEAERHAATLLSAVLVDLLRELRAINHLYELIEQRLLVVAPDTEGLRSLEEYTKTIEDEFKVLKARIEHQVNTRLLFLYSHLEGRNVDGYTDLLREMLDFELEEAHKEMLAAAVAARAEIVASGVPDLASPPGSPGRRNGGEEHGSNMSKLEVDGKSHLRSSGLVLCERVFEWPDRIRSILHASSKAQDAAHHKMEELLKQRKSLFSDELAVLAHDLSTQQRKTNRDSADTYLKQVNVLVDRCEELHNEAEEINSREVDLEVESGQTDYSPQLTAVENALPPLKEMWEMVIKYNDSLDIYLNSPLLGIKFDEAQSQIQTLRMGLGKLAKTFAARTLTAPAAVAKESRDELAVFAKTRLPLMEQLCNKGMKDRHWDLIGELIQVEVEHDEESCLSDMLQYPMMDQIKGLEEICSAAKREARIEKQLNDMEAEWEGDGTKENPKKNVVLKDRESAGTFILDGANIEEIQLVLDEQMLKVTGMKGSRFAKPFMARVLVWEKMLKNLDAVISKWVGMQGAWMYLEPIFASADICRQMPKEAALFEVVNDVWRSNMDLTVEAPFALDVAKREGMLEQLTMATSKLDKIQKGLADYLETKMIAFPRFFFLSPEELLEILSETKNPLKVQQHLKKCFDGIKQLTFEPNNRDGVIVGMESPEKEKVPFRYENYNEPCRIHPQNAHGMVEKWLLDVERVMKKCIAASTDLSNAAYATTERKKWVLQWPGQVVICISQLYWCREVEGALGEHGHQGLVDYLDVLQGQKSDIVQLVRRTDLPKRDRKCLAALLTIDVHGIQVVEEMCRNGIDSSKAFDWMACLRYYWRESECSQTGEVGGVTCELITANQFYGYEYLGCSGRLVITPLTDRCYRTLLGAVQLQLGGAPEGPAGTGKTETTKDLAKALALDCKVFNCSDQLDYKSMAKLFKGIASSGAWICFDEFNRITLEVLSVVAQQIIEIQSAKRQHLKEFTFEGSHIRLLETCNAFITMNPGYAGRAELPDNLKVLFRTVAMMVPDYAMIGEIILYSMGYSGAKALANKIVMTYKLCSEQLSSQAHYDYGMRAVIAVLLAAGALKRKFNESRPEDVLTLQAIMDVNLAKFLRPDIPLYLGIVGDLFPGVELPEKIRVEQDVAIRDVCRAMGLQPTAPFIDKTYQVFEMLLVRHGFMVVGPPFGGKSSAIAVLARSLALLHQRYPDDKQWMNVVITTINPKSISMNDLYGLFDPVSHEWSDGVIPIYYRNMARNKIGKPGERKWVLFDGPVDAIWIENMNTVLDDNKKLCLMNGEVIAMSDDMSMMFEPMDLAVASPATVSRVGIIYLEPLSLGWRPLMLSFLDKITMTPEALAEQFAIEAADEDGEHHDADHAPAHEILFKITPENREKLEMMFELYGDPALAFLRKYCTEQSPTNDSNMIVSCCRLLEATINVEIHRLLKVKREQIPKSQAVPSEFYFADLKLIECAFQFACVWSFGGSTNEAGRKVFDEFMRGFNEDIAKTLGADAALSLSLKKRGWECPRLSEDSHVTAYKWILPQPLDRTVYDWQYTEAEGWRYWLDTLDDHEIPSGAAYNSIVVPTISTAQVEHILHCVVPHRYPTLFVGPTGTGKSAYIMQFIFLTLNQAEYKPIQIGFSAKTSALMTQNIVDGKLEKRRKGLYGPPMGTTGTIFVDDFSMPEVETYGAQPPIELFRQLVDNGGWYDLSDKDKAFSNIVDVTLIAAGPPCGGGRNEVTPRMLRHFNVIGFVDFDDSTLQLVFSTIYNWFFTHTQGMGGFKDFGEKLVNATLQVYRAALANLRPTPQKSHYTFNLRDFSRVTQGVLLVRAYPGFDEASLARLWAHECSRVFGDRLVDREDRRWFLHQMKATISDEIGMAPHTLFERIAHPDPENMAEEEIEIEEDGIGVDQMRALIFADFLDPTAPNRIYKEADDLDSMTEVLEAELEEYNSDNSGKQMPLVLFRFAAEHVARIARVLSMPGGNCLLVGVGGSGRQSLTKLATKIAGCNVEQIEISKTYGMSAWREDMMRIVQSAGGGQTPVVFLFSDTQIKDERFVEDISNLLNSGEIPNLYPPEDKIELLDYVRTQHGKRNRELADMNPAAVYNWFVARTRTQLHIVLAFSPIGDAFRERLRKFPSLINCCTIDWFTAWPDDALNAVAVKFLGGIELGDSFKDICDMCQTFHSSVDKLSGEFRAKLGRINYLTPTSYLALITAYQNSLGTRREHVMGLVNRYENGLVALNDAATAVGEMQEELVALQPTLKESQKATKKLLAELAEKLPGVNAQKEKVAADAAEVQIEVDRVGGIKATCDEKLGEAMPILNDAIASLDVLTTKDIQMAGSFSTPPKIIDYIVGAVCVMMGIKPKRIPDPDDPSKKIEDFWTPGKQMLKTGAKLLDQLKGYDKDNIDPKILKKIRSHYINDERFTVEKAAGASSTMVGFVKWTRAMSSYDEVVQIVAPLRAALEVAEKELAEANAILDKKKAALKVVVDDLNELEAKLAGANKKKKDLEDQVADCEAKLIRARQLIESLGGEKDRWTEEAVKQRAAYENLTGDVLIAAGAIAYLGPFTSDFRDRTIASWVELCQSKGIPSSEVVSLNSTLGDPVSAMTWKSQGLPSDDFSIDNAIVIFNSERWPLLIDPEGQGNRWIRNMEESRGLHVIKLTGKNYLRTLEFALPNGQPVLLENVGEVLDPTLEPLLLKQTFAAAGVMNIRLGDKDVEYSDAFRFYITTKLRNPHYLPEVAVKVTLLNFMITPAGLQAQVLVKTVELERPELAKTARSLVVEGAANAKMLKELEDKILQTLAAEGNILEDVAAVDTLKEAKETAKVIEAKDRVAKKTTADIALVREGYIPVAFRVQLLFFCISALFFIEPVYAYSLDWYIRLYETATRQAEASKDLDVRMNALKEFFTFSLYKNICRSLLEKDKLLFSFMLTCKIMDGEGDLDQKEWLFLLTGGISSGGGPENPCPDWLPSKSWGEIVRLSDIAAFEGLKEGFAREAAEWKVMYDTVEAHEAPLPRKWNTKLTLFQKLMALRCIRPDKIVLAVQNFIIANVGEKYCKPPSFDLKACYEDSSVIAPLIFILSPGSDPQAGLDKLCDQMGVQLDYKISLGQGQGEKAARYIEKARKEGKWVELMNCHLAVSWMSDLEAIVESINEDNTHPAFRLWLTTYPSKEFPVSILQNGVKMTNEPPKGLRANLIGSYLTDPILNPDFWNGIDGGRGPRAEAFRKLIFGLTFFHAIIQERRNFGPLGWNIPYEFNESDLRICVKQLSMFMSDAPCTKNEEGEDVCIVPYNALRYTCGECNYGGRVTDDKDRRALHCILRRFYTSVVVEVPNNPMSVSGNYVVPTDGAHKSYLQQLDAWALVSAPEVFCMHENANITKDQKETNKLFASALDSQGSSSSSDGGGRDAAVMTIAADFETKLPGLYDMELAEVKYPTLWENSMNTVIVQELERFNILVAKVRSDFLDVQLAIQGLVVMSEPLEKVANALYIGRVPMDPDGNYFNCSYPSLKPLAGYMTDLFQRLEFMQDWLDNGPPPNFWLSGFYFNQAFLTGTLQNFARKYTIPIDVVEFDFHMMPEDRYDAPPKDGVYVYGLFLEGCRWDKHAGEHGGGELAESKPKMLYTLAPTIWLKPARMSQEIDLNTRAVNIAITSDLNPFPGNYACPVYKTSDRRGMLSTTGHSTNFVMFCLMPIATETVASHWVQRGVCMLTQLDE